MKSRNDFIKALNYELRLLNQNERDELISFYEDRFANAHYEGKSEADVITELESPAQIARNIYDEYGIDPSNLSQPRKSDSKVGLIIGLIFLDLFIVTWAIPALYGVTFGLGGALFTFPFIFKGVADYGVYANVLNIAFGVASYFLLLVLVIFLVDVTLNFTAWIVSLHVKVFDFELSERIRRFPKENNAKKLLKTKNWNLKFLIPLCVIALIASPIVFLTSGQSQVNWFKRGEVNTELISESYSYDYNSMTELDFDIVNSDITVVLGNTDKIKVQLEYYEEDQFRIEMSSNTIKLRRKDSKYTFNFFNLFSLDNVFKNGNVTVILPKDAVLRDTSLKTVSGNIDLTDYTGGDLELGTVSGNIIIDTVEGDQMKFDTISGNVKIYNVIANEITIETVSGDVDLTNLERVAEGIDIDTVSGDTVIKDVFDTNIEVDSVSGDATYYSPKEGTRSNVDFDSVSGKFTLK